MKKYALMVLHIPPLLPDNVVPEPGWIIFRTDIFEISSWMSGNSDMHGVLLDFNYRDGMTNFFHWHTPGMSWGPGCELSISPDVHKDDCISFHYYSSLEDLIEKHFDLLL